MSPVIKGVVDPMSPEVPKYPAELVIASDPAKTRLVQEEIEKGLRSHKYGDRDIFCIRLALEEALSNAIKHGNQMDRAKKVHIAYRMSGDRVDILITDEGAGFNPDDLPDPTLAENLERPSGRGVMLMRHYMNDVQYNARGNAVAMIKVRKDLPRWHEAG